MVDVLVISLLVLVGVPVITRHHRHQSLLIQAVGDQCG